MSKKKWIIVLLILLLIVAWASWRIIPYLAIFPQRVSLKPSVYLRSLPVYNANQMGYDPAQTPLAAERVQLSIER